jgi:hypothetical protein
MFYNELIFFNNSTTYIRFASNFAVEKVSELLQSKGMNPEVAIIRAREVFGSESEKASLYIHNLQHFFDTEIIKKVYEYISKKALFKDTVLFGSYDHMLRMMQEVHSVSLSEAELRQIRQISQANSYGIALIRR